MKDSNMNEIKLSDGEWKIIKLLWQSSPKTITQITASLLEDTGWSKHTIITMLGRMEKKGSVRYEEGIKAKQYYPVVKEELLSYSETQSFLKKVYQGSLGMMVNTMLNKSDISQEEIDELYDILQKAERDR